MPKKTAEVGQSVFYKTGNGEVLAAIITKVHDEKTDNVALNVFTPFGTGVMVLMSVSRGDENEQWDFTK